MQKEKLENQHVLFSIKTFVLGIKGLNINFASINVIFAKIYKSRNKATVKMIKEIKDLIAYFFFIQN